MFELDEKDINALIDLRHHLHRYPEISGEEVNTAQIITTHLEALGVDQIWRNLGGHGVAAAFYGKNEGKTILLRCELDGLPIQEISQLDYRSKIPLKGHLCGHDGHMASIMGVAVALSKTRPKSGRVILLFQPAEETGKGAQAVIHDPRWSEIRPDYAFAYHNVPSWSLGEIGIQDGVSNCASSGMQILLHGKSAHAATPEDGLSPANAMALLMQQIPQLSHGKIGDEGFKLATLTYAKLGEPSFGIYPSEGELRITLRAQTNENIQQLIQDALYHIEKNTQGLIVDINWHDVFHAVMNNSEASEYAKQATQVQNLSLRSAPCLMSWSEDFGRYGEDGAKSCLIFVGAGENHPQLHNPDYDFPDALIPQTSRLFLGIIERMT